MWACIPCEKRQAESEFHIAAVLQSLSLLQAGDQGEDCAGEVSVR